MKYKNKQDFIKGCNGDGDFRDSAGREVTELDLKKYDILPDFEGKYSGAQKFILCSKIRKEEGHEFYDKEPLAKISSFQFHLGKNINSPAIQKLLLIYLSDKFQREIKNLRKIYGIPENGFGLKDVNGWAKWFMKHKKEIYEFEEEGSLGPYKRAFANPKTPKQFCQELKSCYGAYLDSLIIKYPGYKFPNYKFETKKFLLISQLPDYPFLTDVISLFERYNLTTKEMDPQIWGSIVIFDSWEPLVKSLQHPLCILHRQDSPDMIDITVFGPIKKHELVEYINKNWPEIKNTLDKIFKPVGGTKNLLRDYLVIQLKKQGKSANEIKNILRKEAQYDLKVDQVRQILRRTKDKIKQLESA